MHDSASWPVSRLPFSMQLNCLRFITIHYHVEHASLVYLFRRSWSAFCGCSMMDAVAGDKLLHKELKELLRHLKSMDCNPEQSLSDEQFQNFLGKLRSSSRCDDALRFML